jgi:hypothetical protein
MIKCDCYFYNFGGNMERGFISYPKTYGQRCEKYKKFFTQLKKCIIPNCESCKYYKSI